MEKALLVIILGCTCICANKQLNLIFEFLFSYFNAHMATKLLFTKCAPGLVIRDKICALGVGTMQNRPEGQYTIPAPSCTLPGIQLTLPGLLGYKNAANDLHLINNM